MKNIFNMQWNPDRSSPVHGAFQSLGFQHLSLLCTLHIWQIFLKPAQKAGDLAVSVIFQLFYQPPLWEPPTADSYEVSRRDHGHGLMKSMAISWLLQIWRLSTILSSSFRQVLFSVHKGWRGTAFTGLLLLVPGVELLRRTNQNHPQSDALKGWKLKSHWSFSRRSIASCACGLRACRGGLDWYRFWIGFAYKGNCIATNIY